MLYFFCSISLALLALMIGFCGTFTLGMTFDFPHFKDDDSGFAAMLYRIIGSIFMAGLFLGASLWIDSDFCPS